MLQAINIFLLVILFSLPFLYNVLKVDNSIFRYTAFSILSAYSFAVTLRYVVLKKQEEIRTGSTVKQAFYFLLMLVSGLSTSLIIGIQTHDQRDSAMAGFGPPLWLFWLGMIFPVLFFLFSFSLSRLRYAALKPAALIFWVLILLWMAYFFDYRPDGPLTEDYDSQYFSSESKSVTPMMATVIGCTGIYMVFIYCIGRFKSCIRS